MMKKTIAVLLSITMILSLTACGSSAGSTEQPPVEKDSAEESVKDAESTVDNSANSETSADSSNTGDRESIENEEAQQEDTETVEVQGGKVLVAYFSATNTTKGVAEHIANGLQADIYEIVPEEPYTDADLDYHDNSSRTTIEMNAPDVRPGISGSVENMEQYDIVFIGYPIWWAEAPRIINTFVESYDFSGKTIVPFCTSGGSGVGSSATNLEPLTSGANWLPGKRLNGSDSQDTVMEWVNSLGLDLGE